MLSEQTESRKSFDASFFLVQRLVAAVRLGGSGNCIPSRLLSPDPTENSNTRAGFGRLSGDFHL